ncbi:hypothetical protein KQI65_12925 [bacterium]|nr:hypothetical protein [bacterium]
MQNTMPMEAVAEPLSFDAIADADLAAFHRNREKMTTAVCDRIAHASNFEEIATDPVKTRIAHESVRIFIENFYATAKYRLPAALLEYLDWLRGYLASREFPANFLPLMLASLKIATHAFMEHNNCNDIAAVISDLRRRESKLMGGEAA